MLQHLQTLKTLYNVKAARHKGFILPESVSTKFPEKANA